MSVRGGALTIAENSLFSSFQVYRLLLAAVALFVTLQLSGCASDSQAAKGASQGGATGALAGAAGGLVSSLVFGGNPMEGAARGAVWGGTAGAVAGGVAGSQADKQIDQQRQANIENIRKEIGDDAFEGLSALADCDYGNALSYAGTSQQSSNPNYALAGLWLEVLTYADQGNEAKARAMFPDLVEKDWDVSTTAQAEGTMRDAISALGEIRERYELPRVCGA